MAQPDTNPTDKNPDIDEAFVADRQIFWSRFTTATMGAAIAVAALLIGLLLFVA